ncbi:hypothetical protein AAD018_010495 [Aestuariibius insulae]|uniref:hypothetical protein n=1 Tax=Aestuariibius insulae TaxID=2058287 RepID=UPI00345E0843
MTTEPILTLHASAPRRAIACLVVGFLGLLLLSIAFFQPPAPVLQFVLLVLGAGAIWAAETMRRATALAIVLTEEGLFETSGRRIASMENIVAVQRGPFAFKPSNGFSIVLAEKGPGAWAPGLWWRLGRRVGIGGVTAKPVATAMAEEISRRIRH